MSTQTKVTGVILAGGMSRRMGGQDKALMLFKDRPMVSYAISAMAKVADQTIINANRNIPEYHRYDLPIVSDKTSNFDGPLAGILAAMLFTETGILLVSPCDSPLFQAKHLQRLLSSLRESDGDVVVACDGERLHPMFLAINTRLKTSLQDYLAKGNRKVDAWLAQHNLVKVDFSAEADIFININTSDELHTLESRG